MKETRKQIEIKTIKYGFENFYVAIDRIYATLRTLNDAAKKLEEYIIQAVLNDSDGGNNKIEKLVCRGCGNKDIANQCQGFWWCENCYKLLKEGLLKLL